MKILRSICLTVLFSALIAALFTHYIIVFFIALVLQFVIFYIGRTMYEDNLTIKLFALQAEREKEAKKQFAIMECPCTEKVKQEVEIILVDGEYTCSKCDKKIRTSVEVKNILATDPIMFENPRV